MNKYYCGLQWKRGLVDWGWRGKKGTLRGKIFSSEKVVDCSKQIGFYVLYNKSEIVYIGNSWKYDLSSYYLYDCLKNMKTVKNQE